MRNISPCLCRVTHTSFVYFAELLCVGKTPRVCGLSQMWWGAWSEWAEGESPEPVHPHDLLLQKGRSKYTNRDIASAFSSLRLHSVPWPTKLDQGLSYILLYSALLPIDVNFLFRFSRTWCSSLMTVALWNILFCLPTSPPSLRAKKQSIQKLYLGNFQRDQESKYVYAANCNVKNKDFFFFPKLTSNIISDLPIFLCLSRKWTACLAYLLSCWGNYS